MERKKCSFKRVFLVFLSWTALLFLSFGFIYLFISLENNIYLLIFHCILILFLSLCFLKASLMDPGYFPVGFPNEYDKEIETKGFKPPMVKDIVINSINTKLKWCLTCKIYRPPRVSHCSICQRCVDIFDHHCPWINNCVGKRNYRCFFMFLISTVIHGYFSLIRSILIIINHKDVILTFYPVLAIVLVCLTLIFLLPLTGLACFHIFLISNARTTNEHVTSKFFDGMNPYDKGFFWNVIYFLCRTEYTRFHYLPKKSVKKYPEFYQINEKLGQQKQALMDELRGKLKRTDMPKIKSNDGINRNQKMSESFIENKRPVVPPYTKSSTPIKKLEKTIPPVPPHGSNRLSSTSSCNNQTTIIIPPSVPPHRSQSNSQSETNSVTRVNTPVYHHNISTHDVSINSTKKNLINSSMPNMESGDDWLNKKKSSLNNLSPKSIINTKRNSQHLPSNKKAQQSLSTYCDDCEIAIIQRPALNIKSRPSLKYQNQPPITFLNNQKDLTASMISMSQRNRLISNGRLAQFENQSPPPEGTVEISI